MTHVKLNAQAAAVEVAVVGNEMERGTKREREEEIDALAPCPSLLIIILGVVNKCS